MLAKVDLRNKVPFCSASCSYYLFVFVAKKVKLFISIYNVNIFLVDL